jgi:hypothetical protein
MDIKYIYIYIYSNLGPYKIYPNWDFWFEKKLSGNPVVDMYVGKHPRNL